MDTLSHGLYGGVAFGRTSKKDYALGFLCGVLPDLLSFGLLFVLTTLGLVVGPNWGEGTPSMDSIPSYVHTLYDITHSFVPIGIIIALVWWWRGTPYMPLFAWPLHILVDIPTHTTAFFPTPFLWPLVEYRFDGVSWGHPYIFIPNILLLVVLYVWFFLKRRKR